MDQNTLMRTVDWELYIWKHFVFLEKKIKIFGKLSERCDLKVRNY